MLGYLKTDPKYSLFKEVYLWNNFSFKDNFGGQDVGIDLVAITEDDEYYAIQCKFFDKDAYINKDGVDTFLSTSSRSFDNGKHFAHRMFISTTNKWSSNAEEALKNQNPAVSRISLNDLEESNIDWNKIYNGIYGKQALNPKKKMFDHQIEASEKAHAYFKEHNSGKLIMACGTGKTFTSLNIAEKETDSKGLILFLIPSIALLGQTLNEWFEQAQKPIEAICICSDPKVSKKKGETIDGSGFSTIDLALPATTDTKTIKYRVEKALKHNKGMTVVFSTYQSIDVISEAQKKFKHEFDLVICDEAHRTTGVTLANEDESHFVKVHDNKFIKAKKRLYMTATPRLYSEDSKAKAKIGDHTLCSMDDESIYGHEIYRIGFGAAVEKNLLSDYKVLIFTVFDKDFSVSLQNAVADSSKEINTDDASKLVGCINALSKNILVENDILKLDDPEPMRRAVAFCQSIYNSKKITESFNSSSDLYYKDLSEDVRNKLVQVHSKHVDGTMNALERNDKLHWLKEEIENENECRILTNVRCLSEGVDVPSLDAVLFLSAKNSQIDVVQSVGRVMRKSEGKKYGYIIIPIIIPSDIEPDKALNDNKRYAVVWTVLNALRAHDDRFNAIVNKIELNKNRDDRILIGGRGLDRDDIENIKTAGDKQFTFPFQEYQNAIYAKLVEKVGDKRYWEQWAKDVADIASRYVERINSLIKGEGEHKKEFENFLAGLQKNINPTITSDSAIEMLAQHMITQPVFDALFENYSFAKNNVVSISMSKMIDLLEKQAFNKDLESLEGFYESVKTRAKGIDNAEGKQKIIIELYDKFFKTAFPKMVEQLGIVYTPVECVNFIVKSTEHIPKEEFGRSLSDENVHIIDPFTGTGTFITTLLSEINPRKLQYKYANEIHANEIVLLAYYISSINIENTYHDKIGGNYRAFDGICLTDTFHLFENKDNTLISKMFPENIERLEKQKKAPIQVIISNPPYSIGQKSINDNAQNLKYEKLEQRITDSYVKESNAKAINSNFDSYIKAFRWATDSLSEDGLVSFISNGTWLDSNSADGFRKCLEKDYSKIYIFNLRGNALGKGEIRKKEGGGVFGGGSRTPVAITFLIKQKDKKHDDKAKIFYYDIGDYHTREKKLKIISGYGNVGNISWERLLPNEHGDWLSQRGAAFGSYIALTPDKKFNQSSKSFFTLNSLGIGSARDPYVYNYSKKELSKNMKRMIDFYNNLVKQYEIKKNKNDIPNFDHSEVEIKWSVNLKKDLEKCKIHTYEENATVESMYRAFCKQYLYFDKDFIHRPSQNLDLFPSYEHKNNIILCSGLGGTELFSTIMTNAITDLNILGASAQIFPLYYYKKKDTQQGNFLETDEYIRESAISPYILAEANKKYGHISDEDIFYYVYGILHNEGYREKYRADLKRSLPRIPLLEKSIFEAFSKAGRKLADLHLNYENHKPLKQIVVEGIENNNFKVSKMRYLNKEDKSVLEFNSSITIKNIPLSAYKYMVNGRSAIEWIIDRYQVRTHKESNITNDPNKYCDENGNPRYIFDLLLSVISLSVETVGIVEALPVVEWE